MTKFLLYNTILNDFLTIIMADIQNTLKINTSYMPHRERERKKDTERFSLQPYN